MARAGMKRMAEMLHIFRSNINSSQFPPFISWKKIITKFWWHEFFEMVKIQNEVFGKWMLLCMARALEIKMWFERTTFFDSLFEARLASHWFLRYHFDVKSPKTLIVAQDISMLSLKSVSYVVFHFGEETFLLYHLID